MHEKQINVAQFPKWIQMHMRDQYTIKVALHINGNETDHSINVWGQVETDLEKNLIKINSIWIKDLNIKMKQ